MPSTSHTRRRQRIDASLDLLGLRSLCESTYGQKIPFTVTLEQGTDNHTGQRRGRPYDRSFAPVGNRHRELCATQIPIDWSGLRVAPPSGSLVAAASNWPRTSPSCNPHWVTRLSFAALRVRTRKRDRDGIHTLCRPTRFAITRFTVMDEIDRPGDHSAVMVRHYSAGVITGFEVKCLL